MTTYEVLREFTQDVEAVGIETVAEEWPDLIVTYRKAQQALAEQDEAEHCICGEPRPCPHVDDIPEQENK